MPVNGPFHEIVNVLSEDRLLLRDRLKFFNSLGDLPSHYQVLDDKYVTGSFTSYQLFHDVLGHIFSISGTLTFRQLKEKLRNNGFPKAAELLDGINDVDGSSEMSDVSYCGTRPIPSRPISPRGRQKKAKPPSFNRVEDESEVVDRSTHGQRTCPSLHWKWWIIIFFIVACVGVGMASLMNGNVPICGDNLPVEGMEVNNKELRDLNKIYEEKLDTQSYRIDDLGLKATCEDSLNIQSARVDGLEALKSKCEGVLKTQSHRIDGLEKQLSKNENELRDVRRKHDDQLAAAKLLEGREQGRKENEKKICKCNDKLMDNLRDHVNQCNMEKTFVTNDLQAARRYNGVYFGFGFMIGFPLVFFCIAGGHNVADGRRARIFY